MLETDDWRYAEKPGDRLYGTKCYCCQQPVDRKMFARTIVQYCKFVGVEDENLKCDHVSCFACTTQLDEACERMLQGATKSLRSKSYRNREKN